MASQAGSLPPSFASTQKTVEFHRAALEATFPCFFNGETSQSVSENGKGDFMLSRSTTRVLGLLCVMYFIAYVDRVNVSTAAIVFGKEFNLSNTQVGFVFSAFVYPYLIFQIIGGWVGDRFGPRRTLAICSFIWAGATVLTGLAGGLASMVLARILLGLGEGATFPTATWQASSASSELAKR
jgi:MFS family permease